MECNAECLCPSLTLQRSVGIVNEMQEMEVKPDEVTMVSCLSVCAQLGALDVGIWIHRYIEKHSLSLNVVLGTALVDMYAKWGTMRFLYAAGNYGRF